MIPRYRVIILAKATEELYAIDSHLRRKRSIAAADAVGRMLSAAIDSLDTLPSRFPVRRGPRGTPEQVYRMPVGNYLVYYRIDEANLQVRILDVRRGARRQPRSFP